MRRDLGHWLNYARMHGPYGRHDAKCQMYLNRISTISGFAGGDHNARMHLCMRTCVHAHMITCVHVCMYVMMQI